MPCLSTPIIDHAPLREALSELSRAEGANYKEAAEAAGAPFRKTLRLMNMGTAPAAASPLSAVELVNLARYADVPLEELGGGVCDAAR